MRIQCSLPSGLAAINCMLQLRIMNITLGAVYLFVCFFVCLSVRLVGWLVGCVIVYLHGCLLLVWMVV